jgi:hypothetical protein
LLNCLVDFMLNSIAKFAYQWYFAGSKGFWGGVVKFIKTMDRDLGVVANIYNWTSPLYGDYSYIGKVAGPIFRTLRIFIGSVFYLGVVIFAFFLYAVWLVLPALIGFMIVSNLAAMIAN